MTLICNKFSISYFGEIFFGALLLLLVGCISSNLSFICSVIIILPCWMIFDYLVEREVNNWLKHKMRVEVKE